MIRYTPGKELRVFDIKRKVSHTDEKRRTTYSIESVGARKAMLAQAKQNEREQWQQMGHPITHTITGRGKSDVRAEDVLVLGTRKFYVQGKNDPADLGIYEIIYCEERMGV